MTEDYGEEYEKRTGVKEWFTRPPYLGAWVIVGFVLGIVLAAVGLRSKEAPQAPQVVVQAPSEPAPPVTVTPAPAGPAPSTEEEAPQVQIRTLPGSNAPAEQRDDPAADGSTPGSPAEAPKPGNAPGDGSTPFPNTSSLPSVPEPDADAPSPIPEPERPRIEEPVVPVVPEPRPVEPPPVVREPRRPRETRVVPVPVPARETGRVSIYFDADSSTFDRRGERLPLRVEVYVNGERRLSSNDPEKREFNLGRLPEGNHEIEIVPYVGGLPAEPRRERIRVSSRQRNQFKAVLRRDEGASRVSKFRER